MSSKAASTKLPPSRYSPIVVLSEAMKRIWKASVGSMTSATRKALRRHEMSCCKVFSRYCQVLPPSLVTSTCHQSEAGLAPVAGALAYHRQYVITGFSYGVKSMTGDTSVVWPPSTSLAPMPSPSSPLSPVMKANPKNPWVWSCSGATTVEGSLTSPMEPTGISAVQMPVVALSVGRSMSQLPKSENSSKSSRSTDSTPTST